MLLSSNDNKHMLIDGGMKSSYSEHVAPYLGRLAKSGAELDIVYVSHIDQDHINGVLQLMDDTLDWRVHDYQTKVARNNKFPAPNAPRPPKVRRLWNNTFSALLDEKTKPIEDLLASNLELVHLDAGAIGEYATSKAPLYENLVSGVSDGIKLTNRVDKAQLNIPTNPEFTGKLMALDGKKRSLKLGKVKFSLLGPTKEDLRNLRKEWTAWLDSNTQAVEKIRKQAEKDAGLFPSESEWVLSSLRSLAHELGKRDKVTPPNLASIMVLAEESGKSILFTGDGHHRDILNGLRLHKKLDKKGRVHVNILKVQHHGSEHNIHADFCKAVTADHYVFCANGAHQNPDLRAIEAIIDSRLAPSKGNPNATRIFKLWFNSSRDLEQNENSDHMNEVYKLVRKKARSSKGRMKYRFLNRGSKFVINL